MRTVRSTRVEPSVIDRERFGKDEMGKQQRREEVVGWEGLQRSFAMGAFEIV
jgi:hypothetical protein